MQVLMRAQTHATIQVATSSGLPTGYAAPLMLVFSVAFAFPPMGRYMYMYMYMCHWCSHCFKFLAIDLGRLSNYKYMLFAGLTYPAQVAVNPPLHSRLIAHNFIVCLLFSQLIAA